MQLFGYTIEKTKLEPDIKTMVLDKAKGNAELGLIQAKLELRHHGLLLKQLEAKLPPNEKEKETLERDITLTKEAIERDEKSINNWETQLKSISYEQDSN